MQLVVPRRRLLQLILLLAASIFVSLSLIRVFWPHHESDTTEWQLFVEEPSLKIQDLPPLFGEYHQAELKLPQHDLDLPFPEGRSGRYFYVGNHQRSVGWGNVLQEMLLLQFLTLKSGRTFVFDNYTWDRNSDYSFFNGKPIPSRMPLSTLMRGPGIGAPYATAAQDQPRAVKKEFWDVVCPEPTKIINDELIKEIGWGASAKTIVNKYLELLATDDPCIETPADTWSIFDIYMFGDHTRLLDIWPEFSTSPVLREYGYSPLVEGVFDNNRAVFAPSATISHLSPQPFTTMTKRYPPIPGLIVLHIRRGDFAEHCQSLSYWNAVYTGFNAFPELSDKFSAVPDLSEEERLVHYLPHCYPSIEDVVKRVKEIRDTDAGQGLRDVYVMTNADPDWAADLKTALKRHAGPWTSVATSRDLAVNREERYVKQAVDLLIGQRAQVFIGNGFSSLSAMVVMMRMASNIPADQNRLW